MIIFTILGIIFLVAILVNIVIAIIQEVLSKEDNRVYCISHCFYKGIDWVIIPTIVVEKGHQDNHSALSIRFQWLCGNYELFYHIKEE